MERIEVRDAVDAQDHGLAVEDEARLPDLAGGLHDPGIAAGPVMAVASEQTHAITVPLDAEAVAVLFHFVEPFGAGRHGLAGRGEAELKTGHGPKSAGFANPSCSEATQQEYRDELNICRIARSAVASIGPSSGSFSVKEAANGGHGRALGATARPDC
jgi:hypothetical protein